MSSQPTPVGAATPGDEMSRSVLLSLRSLPLFARLTDEEFKEVMALLHSDTVRQGDLLYELGGTNTNLYMVRRGRAVVRRVNPQGMEYIERPVGPGDALNEKAFLTGLHCEESVEAIDAEVKLWAIARADFQDLLSGRPLLRAHLQLSPEIEDILRRQRRRDWLRPDERVLLYRKKHPWIYLRIALPLVMLAVVAIVAAGALLPGLFPYIAGAITVATLLAVGWGFIDWQNDFYALTDQRVIHRERVLLLRDAQDEIPLNRIQDVTVVRTAFNPIEMMIQLFLDIGSVVIQAQGARAQVRFADIGAPDEVNRLIFEQRGRARGEMRVSQRSRIRTAIRREIGLVGAAPDSAAAGRRAGAGRMRQGFGLLMGSLRSLPRTLAPATKIRQGNAVVYRKHWFYLFRKIAGPVAASLLFMLVLVVIGTDPAMKAMVFGTILVAGVAVLGLVLAFWMLWRYEDWRNDYYVVTPDRLIDVVRSPFGLRGTQRREAGLHAVQTVTATTRGLADMLVNMGDVVIKTGGAAGDLNFQRVYDPRGVQREIVNRIEAFEAGQREAQADARRKELAEWIGIYDELTRLHERKRIL